MKTKRFFHCALIGIMILSLLAGCASGGGASSTAPAASSGTPTASGQASASSAEPAQKAITIKIANMYGEDMTETKSLYEFEKLLEERSGGAIAVEVYPNCQLGSEEALCDGVRQGTIEMVVVGGALASHVPFVVLPEFPFLFNGWKEANEVLHNPDVVAKLTQGAEDIGLTPLGFCPSGFRAISSNKVMNTFEDLQGMRLRVPNVPIYIEMAKNLGVNAVALPMTELFTALEQKVADGQETSPSIFHANKYYEVQSAYLVSYHMFTAHGWYINTQMLEGLSDDLQKAVLDCAAEAIAYDWRIAEQGEKDTLKFLEEYGLEIVYPDDVFVQKMRDSQIPTKEWIEAQTPGSKDIIALIESLQ